MPGDQLLYYFIRLQRLKEEINDTFDYDDYQDLAPMDTVRIELLLKTFNKQLAQIRESFLPEAWENTAISLTYYNLRIYLNEIALHAVPPDSTDTFGPDESCRSWFSSVARADALITCVDAAKDYLDRYLALSTEQVRCNTIVEEVKVVYAFLVLGKFVSGINTPHIDALDLRKSANMEYYMDGLINRMSDLIVSFNGQEQLNYFWHFRALFKFSRIWYEQQIKGEYFTTLGSSGVPDCADMSILESVTYRPDDDTPLSDTNSSWSNKEKVWGQHTPMAVPMPMSKLPMEKLPLDAQLFTGFFDELPHGLPHGAVSSDPLDFDYTAMDMDGMEFMQGP